MAEPTAIWIIWRNHRDGSRTIAAECDTYRSANKTRNALNAQFPDTFSLEFRGQSKMFKDRDSDH